MKDWLLQKEEELVVAVKCGATLFTAIDGWLLAVIN